jgi:hypothetical protein
MRTVTILIADDVYEHASTVARYRGETAEAHLAQVLTAAMRRELLDEQSDLDGPRAGEDLGGNFHVDHGGDPRTRRRRGM